MKKNKNKNGFFWALLTFILFSCVVGYANWVQANLLPQPTLNNILLSNLINDEWKSKESPLFPPTTNWDSSFDYSISLTSRWKPNLQYKGYSGGGQLSKLEQEVPFITFFITCRIKQSEQNYVRSNNLYNENIGIGNNSMELALLYYKLDEEDRKDYAKRTGNDNCIGFNASFSFQSYEYKFHGIFPTNGPEFSLEDQNILQVRRILLQYVNDMLNNYEPAAVTKPHYS